MRRPRWQIIDADFADATAGYFQTAWWMNCGTLFGQWRMSECRKNIARPQRRNRTKLNSLAYTKRAENGPEQIVRGMFAGDVAQCVLCSAQIVGGEFCLARGECVFG
jgi:hypothetical protein